MFASPRGSDARGARLRARSLADRSPTDPAARDADAAPGADAARDASAPSPRADPDASSDEKDHLGALLARADGAVNQAFVSLLGGDLDARVPARRPPTLGSLVSVAGPVPELHWHAAVATDAGREDVVAALTGGFFREPVILRGAADEWPAVCQTSRRWTLARLVNDHGDFTGDVRVRDPDAAAAAGLPPRRVSVRRGGAPRRRAARSNRHPRRPPCPSAKPPGG